MRCSVNFALRALALLFAYLLFASQAFAGCGAACYPGEEQIGLYPNLMGDLAAQAATSANTYFDQQADVNKTTANGFSPSSYNWLTTSAPTLTSNADSTGFSAWTFNGSTANNIQANFTGYYGEPKWPLVGDFSLVIEADLNASTPTTGSTVYALAGSGLTAANGWVLGINQRKLVFCYTGQTTCTALGSALSTGTPHLIVFAWSSVDQIAGVSVDGGAFSTTNLSSVIQAATPTDATLWIGASASSSYSPWWGNIFRVLLFKESLQNSAKAAQLAYVQALFAAKY
jgi:hypothetical protein